MAPWKVVQWVDWRVSSKESLLDGQMVFGTAVEWVEKLAHQQAG
jgi:hypothetical protein